MKRLIILLFTFFVISVICTFGQENHTAKYQNPVISGDFPDPTIIRVGDLYYAAGTSNDFAPNYPIYESKDLINWQRIGSVFSDPPNWTFDDFWAPELFYRDGTYYIYYTAKRKDTKIACIGVATTKDIRKGFIDRGIIIEWGEEAIDAFVFKDDDGKLYITWKAYGLTENRDIEILASELSSDGLHLIGDPFSLTDHEKGWKGAGDEGQCLVKRNGYYYLLYSIGGCCDNRCDYRVMVARSKDLKSGWEQYPTPILQGGDNWRCPGHGTLVSTPDKRDFYMYHSYNATDFEYIGRQGMLDELVWDVKSGWPHFKNGDTPSVEAVVPFAGTYQLRDSIWIDDFTTDKNQAFWEWDVHHPKPSVVITKGEMEITTKQDGISFLGLRPQTGDYNLATEVIPTQYLSGIGFYSNRQNLLALVVNHTELVLFKIKNGEKEVLSHKTISLEKSIFLKYSVQDGRYYRYFWSENGTNWQELILPQEDQFDASFIPQWGFSPRAGFVTEGNNGNIFHYSNLDIHYSY